MGGIEMFKKEKQNTEEKTLKTKLYTEDEILDMILDAHHELAEEALDKDATAASMQFMLTGIVVVGKVKEIMQREKGKK